MEMEEVQLRILAEVARLTTNIERPGRIKVAKPPSKIEDDLDLLRFAVTYFIFDREASIREAMKLGG